MKNTGLLLKTRRESSNLSISEVALSTKINPRILAAIEEGDEPRLPARTFLKGFVRTYAVFLKMDVDEVMRSYQAEMGAYTPVEKSREIIRAHVPEPPPASSTAPRRRVGQETSSGMRTAAVVVIVLLIGVIILVREVIEKYQREKTVETSAVKVSPLALPPADAPPPAIAAPAEGADTVPPTSDEVTVAPPAPAPPAPAPPPVTAPPPFVQQKNLVEATTPPMPAPPPATDAQPAGKNEIILEALDKVDVKFQIKGETKRLSLGPTQVQTIHSDEPVTLDFSDGGAVNIILNGRERGVPGDLGKPKQIRIP